MLTFATPTDEAQAAQLMQPCLIRVVDNIRKHTETLEGWRSEYLEQVRWPATATADQCQRVRDLAAQLEGATPEAAAAIRQQLADLPTPSPVYQLQLTAIAAPASGQDGTSQEDPSAPPQTATVDVWDLCFAVCFRDYHPQRPAGVDPALLDADGEIDWLALDQKAKVLVEQALDQALAG
jgi:hypothetical protein